MEIRAGRNRNGRATQKAVVGGKRNSPWVWDWERRKKLASGGNGVGRAGADGPALGVDDMFLCLTSVPGWGFGGVDGQRREGGETIRIRREEHGKRKRRQEEERKRRRRRETSTKSRDRERVTRQEGQEGKGEEKRKKVGGVILVFDFKLDPRGSLVLLFTWTILGTLYSVLLLRRRSFYFPISK